MSLEGVVDWAVGMSSQGVSEDLWASPAGMAKRKHHYPGQADRPPITELLSVSARRCPTAVEEYEDKVEWD